jgi:hypothetical protein
MSENLQDIQAFLNRLVAYYLAERKLKLNEDKCKVLKFRNKGRGRYKAADVIKVNNKEIEFVTEFIYLGVKFQASGTSFSKHIDKRVKASIFASAKLTSLPKTSVETALKIFDLAISPVASYGIEAVWQHLTTADLHKLETAKTRFLKKALCLSKFTKSRFVYELADTGLFIEDLRLKYNLPETDSYSKFLTNKRAIHLLILMINSTTPPHWSPTNGKNLVLQIDICLLDTPATAFIMCCAAQKATARKCK